MQQELGGDLVGAAPIVATTDAFSAPATDFTAAPFQQESFAPVVGFPSSIVLQLFHLCCDDSYP